MATGRTLQRWARVYIDGYDMSGYTRDIGPLGWMYDEVEQLSLLDGVKGALPNHPELSIGTLNGLFDNTATSGIHAALSSAGVSRDVLIALGIRANPAAGDPAFMGAFNHNAYQIAPSGNDIALTVPFGKISPAEGMLYEKPWGTLLHANSEATAANTAAGVDDDRRAASTSLGGYLVYQILGVTGTGTVTISIDDNTTNTAGTFGALSGATSGAIAHTAVPCSGIVQLGNTATVKRYLRWQMALDTITACTFVLGFVRA
jgi:hypothetical protein